MNKHKPHVWIIPEDDANRQLADGFVLHPAVDDRRVQVVRPAGGWPKVLEVFESEYLPLLRQFQEAHVIMLIDFDDSEGRRDRFEQSTPHDVKPRVFVIGSKYKPEALKREFSMHFEEIGTALAEECHSGNSTNWQHPHLIHNVADLQRLIETVKPILF